MRQARSKGSVRGSNQRLEPMLTPHDEGAACRHTWGMGVGDAQSVGLSTCNACRANTCDACRANTCNACRANTCNECRAQHVRCVERAINRGYIRIPSGVGCERRNCQMSDTFMPSMEHGEVNVSLLVLPLPPRTHSLMFVPLELNVLGVCST